MSIFSHSFSDCSDVKHWYVERLAIRVNVKLVTRCALALICFMYAVNTYAVPFPLMNARSAALGGVGVAHSYKNASFYNPALAALKPEGFGWYVMVPSTSEFETDPDDVKEGVEQINAGAGDRDAILARIDNTIYESYEFRNFMLVIPTPTLGGELHFADYTFQTAKIVAGGIVDHQAVSVRETGVSAAQFRDIDLLGLRDVLVGVSAKLYLLKSYAYREPIDSANFSLDDDQASRDSVINFDVGLSKEYGVWKTGLVIKNILNSDKKLGDSDTDYNLGPQVRVGLAYQSRRATAEIDLDLTTNKGVGHASDTLYAAFGWEWRVFRGFFLRMGYKQNLVDEAGSVVSGGVGLEISSFLLDFVAVSDGDSEGSAAQLSFKF